MLSCPLSRTRGKAIALQTGVVGARGGGTTIAWPPFNKACCTCNAGDSGRALTIMVALLVTTQSCLTPPTAHELQQRIVSIYADVSVGI